MTFVLDATGEQDEHEAGSATLAVVATMILIGLVGATCFCAVIALLEKHHLEKTADLAAISAAASLYEQKVARSVSSDPCELARIVASRNETKISSCQIIWQLPVTVSVQVEPRNSWFPLTATARSGSLSTY